MYSGEVFDPRSCVKIRLVRYIAILAVLALAWLGCTQYIVHLSTDTLDDLDKIDKPATGIYIEGMDYLKPEPSNSLHKT